MTSSEFAGTIVLYDLTHLHRMDFSELRQRRQAWDELHLVTALQGIVNRRQPRLYVLFVGDDGQGGTDLYWLEHLRQQGEWLDRAKIEKVTQVLELVQRFRRSLNGLVVWDERVPATALVASTAAGVDNLLPVRYDPDAGSLYTRLTQGRGRFPVRLALLRKDGSPLFTSKGSLGPLALPSTGSPKCDALMWAVGTYLRQGKCAPGILGYYSDADWLTGRVRLPVERTMLCNHDYFIARKGFFFDLSPWEDVKPSDDPEQPLGADNRTLKAILMASYDLTGGGMTHIGGFVPWDFKYTDAVGEPHGAVESEWRFVEIASCFNAYLDADAPAIGAMANASFFMHYPLQKRYTQPSSHPGRPAAQGLRALQRHGCALQLHRVLCGRLRLQRMVLSHATPPVERPGTGQGAAGVGVQSQSRASVSGGHALCATQRFSPRLFHRWQLGRGLPESGLPEPPPPSQWLTGWVEGMGDALPDGVQPLGYPCHRVHHRR
jgi:hypothetical protein